MAMTDVLTSYDSQGKERVRPLADVLEAVERIATTGGRSRPPVTLAYAQSIDGCITASDGCRTRISNDSTERMTHSLRAMHEAILIGINTLLVDDPRLTVRHVEGDDPQPVIADSRLRTPLGCRLLQGAGPAPIIATTSDAPADAEAELVAAGAQVWRLPANSWGGVDLGALLDRLGGEGVRSVMVEGGARVITSMLARSLADQLVVTISPRILGGVRAVGPLPGREGDWPEIRDITCGLAGRDLVIHGEFVKGRGSDQ